MNIDIFLDTKDKHLTLDLAERYLPIRLTDTNFSSMGDCVAFLANRADGMYTEITENEETVLFVILYNQTLYRELENDVIKMDYWEPSYNFVLLDGEVNGKKRKVYLDTRAYRRVPQKRDPNKPPHKKVIKEFDSYENLFPYIAYVSEDFRPIFDSTPIFGSDKGFKIKDGYIYSNVEAGLLQYDDYYNLCELKGYNLFYDRYVPSNILGTQYLIYSKRGFEILRDYFFNTSDHASREILNDNVVGAITVLENPAFENTINTMTIFVTTSPIEGEKAINIDRQSEVYSGNPIKVLSSPKMKTFALAGIFYLCKKYNYQPLDKEINYSILGGWKDFSEELAQKGLFKDNKRLTNDLNVFLSLDKTQAKKRYEALIYDIRENENELTRFKIFIENKFIEMDDFDKNLSSLIFPSLKNKNVP